MSPWHLCLWSRSGTSRPGPGPQRVAWWAITSTGQCIVSSVAGCDTDPQNSAGTLIWGDLPSCWIHTKFRCLGYHQPRALGWGRHPSPCVATTRVVMLPSSRLSTVRQPILFKGFWDHCSKMPKSLSNVLSCLIELVASRSSGSVLSSAGWEPDILCGNGTTLLALLAGPSTSLSVRSRGAVNIKRDHILGMNEHSWRVQGKTWLGEVSFSIYATKFQGVNLTWPENKLLTISFTLWGRLSVCGQGKQSTATALESPWKPALTGSSG